MCFDGKQQQQREQHYLLCMKQLKKNVDEKKRWGVSGISNVTIHSVKFISVYNVHII